MKVFKYSGNGNHFILLDQMENEFSFNAARLCDPKFGIGADGVCTITSHAELDFHFRLWNSDGSEAEMCGNAARCAAWHFKHYHQAGEVVSFKTMNDTYQASFEGERLWLKMPEAREDINPEFLQLKNYFYIDTGVPHFVIEVDDVDKLKLIEEARVFRYHSVFPRGVNVDFIQKVSNQPRVLKMRVYERGVEAETWSCGTGVAAVAWAGQKFYGQVSEVSIHTPGGEHKVKWIDGELYYSGKIDQIFVGEWIGKSTP